MVSLNEIYRPTGTRFRVYVQPPVLAKFGRPETIWVSSPAGSVGPGPSDGRMYVLDAIGKQPYEDDFPPYRGPSHPPAGPGPGGHFDHVPTDDPAFRCTHMFACVRRVMDVWETYLGGPLAWPFSVMYSRLEMIPHVPFDNAQFGWGYMECGEGDDDKGVKQPYALNFDILAHETGHAILYALLGMATKEQITTAYRGFHESATDCVAMISSMHFESLIEHLLSETSGDLYTKNELNRIGELSSTRQMRSASNSLKMSDMIPIDTPVKEATGKQIHQLGLPLTGAVFDIMVEFFVDALVERRLITANDAIALRRAPPGEAQQAETTACETAYRKHPAGFREALCEARDAVGLRLAHTWHRLSPVQFSFEAVALTFLEVDAAMTGTGNQSEIRECFEWREIL